MPKKVNHSIMSIKKGKVIPVQAMEALRDARG
jgi:hypothetical protein